MITADEYLRRSVIDPTTTAEFGSLYGIEQTPEQYEAFEEARAETARLAWKPYMFNQSLPNLLEAVANVPTLIIWGEKDQILPFSVGERYLKKYHEEQTNVSMVSISGVHPFPKIFSVLSTNSLDVPRGDVPLGLYSTSSGSVHGKCSSGIK